ncbi:MAG: succinyl-diaminopimelate desuccinylase [Actinomycetota bacterium]
MEALDLTADVVDLTRAICDIESVSGHEKALADAVEGALQFIPQLEVTRLGDAVVARTHHGRAERALLAGHLDTVPLSQAKNLPTQLHGAGENAVLYGRGTCDMKAGVAVQLALAATVLEPARDVTYVFYDGEEVAAEHNGLLRIARVAPELLAADFAVLLEPTNGQVEGGCNGTMRAEITLTGVAAHSARAWMGRNAIHAASDVLARLNAYQPRVVEVDGLRYREGLNAVRIVGGIAGNVIPDRCVVTVNYRFGPTRSPAEAHAHLQEVFPGYEVIVVDQAPGALPGLRRPLARAFVDALGVGVAAKEGWTDVARFSELGIPAVNYGPGDPALAHADDERVPIVQIRQCLAAMRRWLQ